MRKERRTLFGLTGIALALLFLFFTTNWKTSAQQQQQPQGDVPAEQRYKNIQVLKGMPQSQVIPVMQFMASSLGVNCAHCHVNNNGNWEFEKDDKPTKQTARRMIQMTFDINKGNRDIFRGANVSCFTCHRGSTEPVNIPLLPVPPESTGARPGAAAATAETLPTAAQVVDKYLQSIGGRAAAERIKTRVMKGSLIGADGKPMPFEVHLQAPDKALTIITAPQGTVTQAFVGTKGWMKNPRETRELRPNEIARFRSTMQTLDVVQVTEAAASMKVAGREKIGDREAYVVVWPVDDRHTQKLYFDMQTGLLLRAVTYTQSVLGPIPSQVDFEDYRDVEGVKLPFTVRMSSVDARSDSTRKFTEIKANVPADDTQFNPPAATAAPAAPSPSSTPPPRPR
ncbi:MAG: c-type cytochrome [Pyrinomonadaceae bacterium]|nr:c-type cytochrome [Pyrinomonadaceae bacterium]